MRSGSKTTHQWLIIYETGSFVDVGKQRRDIYIKTLNFTSPRYTILVYFSFPPRCYTSNSAYWQLCRRYATHHAGLIDRRHQWDREKGVITKDLLTVSLTLALRQFVCRVSNEKVRIYIVIYIADVKSDWHAAVFFAPVSVCQSVCLCVCVVCSGGSTGRPEVTPTENQSASHFQLFF